MDAARRQWLQACVGSAVSGSAATWAGEPDHGVQPGRRLRFPQDHGAHPSTRTEWWYLTGFLAREPMDRARPGAMDAPAWGFQITFFRSRTGLADQLPGRLAPKQLLFAHAALTTLGPTPRHQHAQHLGRWNGASLAARDHACLDDAELHLGGWQLQRLPRSGPSGTWQTQVKADGFSLDLQLQPTQPVLLQGEQGYSRKGPDPGQASHYYSLPHLAVSGRLGGMGAAVPVQGSAWLDHEWSDEILPAQAEGWDWVGMQLADGGALTAFRLRRAGGGPPVWAGGSFRDAVGRLRTFGPNEVQFVPEQWWTSPTTGARYPVRWRIVTPVGSQVVQALLAAQELDARSSTGTVYWEGLSELLDGSGRRLGLGYLEMTGYAGALKL